MSPFKLISSLISAGLLVFGLHAAAQENILWTFDVNGVDGQHPASNLIFDAKGNLYGATDTGGKNGLGVVFELLPQANGTYAEKILYTFGDGGMNDGTNPHDGLVFDRHGNLFGTTLEGGVGGYGTVFELSPQSDGSWTYQQIYSLGTAESGLDGTFPKGTPAIDAQGNVYGTSEEGGGNDAGAVWELTPPASGTTWTFTAVYEFQGPSNGDGQAPSGGLIFDAEGNLYGQTSGGGVKSANSGICQCGTLYELSPQSGGSWKESILYTFQGSPNDASSPVGAPVFDSAGNLYGASVNGGPDFIGTVYEVSPGASGWTDTILHSFSNANNNLDDGEYPTAGPVFDSLGNLYLTTTNGGAIDGNTAGGVVAQIHPESGGTWKETILHSFPASNSDGYYPEGALLVDTGGNLYGTDFNGGGNGAGIVYEILSPDALAAPVIAPGSGTYSSPQKVKITDTAVDVTLYYTTNGEAPTTSSEIYTEPFVVSKPETIRAIASAPGYLQSKVSAATLAFKAAKPVFTLKPGTYPKAQTVKITDTTPGATIYYNINSKTPPNKSSKKYTGAIAVAENDTLQAIAVMENYAGSAVAEAVYLIETAQPTISPAGGTFSKAPTVTLKDATPGAVLYYTISGTAPTAKSTKYTKAFKLAKSATVRAVAIAPDHTLSAVASAKFTVK